MRTLAAAITDIAHTLRGRRGVRLTPTAHELVWLDGEALCAVPAIADELSSPAWRARLAAPVNAKSAYDFADRIAILERRSRFVPFAQLRRWRSPEVRAAGQLLANGQLLAFGQRLSNWRVQSFLLTEAA